MEWWILVSENSAGEWSVGDAQRDYRICHYNHGRHHGSHIHHSLDAPAGRSVRVANAEDAKHVVRRFAERNPRFDEEKLMEAINEWRSE